MDVGALALEQRMGLEREKDIEIAVAAAAHAGFALAGETDARAVLDAGRDGDVERLLLARAALAAAGATRLFDHLAGAMAGGTGALHREEALLRANAPGAAAGRAVDRLRSRLGAGAVARIAGAQGRHADLRLAAFESFLEGYLEVVAEVVAAIGAAVGAAAAHHRAEHLFEDVGKAAGVEAEIAASAAALLESRVAEAIVSRALLLVLQDVVGLVDVLELLLRHLVARVAVRVILHGELSERLLDVVARGFSPYAEQLIEVLFRHSNYPRSPELRSISRGGELVRRRKCDQTINGKPPRQAGAVVRRIRVPLNPSRASCCRRPLRNRHRPPCRRRRCRRLRRRVARRRPAARRARPRLAACTSPRRFSSRLAPKLRSSP